SGFPRWWGAVCGLLAAAAAVGIGQLFAGFTVPAASPVVAVGGAAIDQSPQAVKDWAISTFGTADKTVLLGGVLVVVFLYSMAVGVLALRWLIGTARRAAGRGQVAATGRAAAAGRAGLTSGTFGPADAAGSGVRGAGGADDFDWADDSAWSGGSAGSAGSARSAGDGDARAGDARD